MKGFFNVLRDYWFLIAPFFLGVFNYLAKTDKRLRRMEKLAELSNERGETIKMLIKNGEDQKQNNDKQNSVLLSTLRYQLLTSINEELGNGSTDLHTRETIAHMYEAYSEMGGNSFIHDMYDKYRNLPIK